MVDTIYFYEPAFKCWGNEHEFFERKVEVYKIFALCTPPPPLPFSRTLPQRGGGGGGGYTYTLKTGHLLSNQNE